MLFTLVQFISIANVLITLNIHNTMNDAEFLNCQYLYSATKFNLFFVYSLLSNDQFCHNL